MTSPRISAADRVRQMAFDALTPAEKTAVLLAVGKRGVEAADYAACAVG
jgi:hypothetical protein